MKNFCTVFFVSLMLPLSLLFALEAPQANLEQFHKAIEPVLKATCVGCHGPDKQKGKFRIDTLNPDLLKGKDVSWWLEVFDVISNSEMPPEDAKLQLADDEKARIVDWLSTEIQVASQVRRSEKEHTSFRRMTRYEYKYAIQDLLDLPYDISRDLPPESMSEDGFKNSSEMLQMTVVQLQQYRQLARKALSLAAVRGEKPKPVYYGVTMKSAAAQIDSKYVANVEATLQEMQQNKLSLEEALKKQGNKYGGDINGAHFKNRITGQGIGTRWSYGGAKYAWKPITIRPEVPPISTGVVVIPAGKKYIFDVGDGLPDSGTMRVRIRASRVNSDSKHLPTLRLFFGNQASNDSRVLVRASDHDITVHAPADKPEFYYWDVRLSEIARNAYRHINKLGQLPNPAEFLSFQNCSSSPVDVQIDYLEITAPVHEEWPPKSHTQIFFESNHKNDEEKYAREVLTKFMRRAWRREISSQELDQKLSLFSKIRPQCHDFQEAILEVLSGVLASPKFLYIVLSGEPTNKDNQRISDFELANRLSFFLWSSMPDDELLDLASRGRLRDQVVINEQIKRLLDNPKSERFSRHFTRQWLGLELLDFLKLDKKLYPRFDPLVMEGMKEEPIAFFGEILKSNRSVMDFLHSDYTMVNDRLAKHYDLPEVIGNEFRLVKLPPQGRRGGVLTQAGLLAMNSDGKDSHPLKRGIWLLENLLNDPPPPPPPAVPEIDLADPEILKLSLKERMEDHRKDPACISCHVKIDPWGIAFENFDAVGKWRDSIGEDPVDSSSKLFNKHELRGMKGLKEYLISERQDQFARALTHKMAAYALGRPLTFGDRSLVDQISIKLRSRGDGLVDLIILIVQSDLFQLK